MLGKLKRLAVALLVFALLVGVGFGISSWEGPQSVQGAPVAAPTPVTQYMANQQPRTLVFWPAGDTITADERSACHSVAGYSQIDLHWLIDHGTVNTTTFTLEFTNIADEYPDGIAMLTDSAADASTLQQFQVFGNTMCIFANVTNTNTLGVQVVGSLK